MSKSIRFADESGQALVEMTVGMVALMCVMLGLLFVSSLGLANIQNALSARQLADEAISSSAGSHAGASILRWNAGEDNMFLTKDDTPVYGLGGAASTYGGELAMDKAEVGNVSSLAYFNLNSLKAASSVDPDAVDAFNGALADASLYVYAAGLVGETSVNDNPLESRHMDNMTGAFGFLTNGETLSLSDTAFMPYIEKPNN